MTPPTKSARSKMEIKIPIPDNFKLNTRKYTSTTRLYINNLVNESSIFTKTKATTCFIILLILDSIIKLITLIINKHPFIDLVTKYKSASCHKLMVFDKFFMIFLKILSIFIMSILGIRATVRGSNGGGLGEWKTFKNWFNVYMILWTLCNYFLFTVYSHKCLFNVNYYFSFDLNMRRSIDKLLLKNATKRKSRRSKYNANYRIILPCSLFSGMGIFYIVDRKIFEGGM
jgi:hypothetical protein